MTLQLWQHATRVRRRSRHRSPTKLGDTRGSCVLCLCYVGEERHIQTLTSCYLITQRCGHRHAHSKHVDLRMILLAQVGVGMLPHSIFPKPLQGCLSHLSSLSTGPLCTQEDVQRMKRQEFWIILKCVDTSAKVSQDSKINLPMFQYALWVERLLLSCHVKHFYSFFYSSLQSKRKI